MVKEAKLSCRRVDQRSLKSGARLVAAAADRRHYMPARIIVARDTNPGVRIVRDESAAIMAPPSRPEPDEPLLRASLSTRRTTLRFFYHGRRSLVVE